MNLHTFAPSNPPLRHHLLSLCKWSIIFCSCLLICSCLLMWKQRHEPRQFQCSEGSDLTSQLILCILTESGQDHQKKEWQFPGNFCHDIQIPTTCAILCTYLVTIIQSQVGGMMLGNTYSNTQMHTYLVIYKSSSSQTKRLWCSEKK